MLPYAIRRPWRGGRSQGPPRQPTRPSSVAASPPPSPGATSLRRNCGRGPDTSAALSDPLAIAEESGATPAQVSVGWVRERAAQASTSFVPIIGPRNLAQLDDNLGALDVQLTSKQFAHLSDVSALPFGVPHETSAGIRNVVQGGDASLVIQPAGPVA
ncbi:aldo/keto reductase [Streptomyces sp. NPDC001178]